MKTTKTIRSIVAMTVTFFAVTATSCNKESEIAPTTPVVPPPAVPVVSMKPISIITTENGSRVRKQLYVYNAQGKLTKYESIDAFLGLDSVLLRSNNVSFKTTESNNISQSLTFNADKTFQSLFTANDQTNFESNQSELALTKKIRVNNTPLTTAQFVYTNNNLTTMGAEIRIDINYHNNLPYQKGINEIPVALKPIKFYKIMEMENATSTLLYNKLIKQIIFDFGNRRELHDYTYTFDANQRVTQIRDTQTFVTSSTSTQKVLVSTITY